MKITVKKLFAGNISLRDYDVNEAIKNHEDIEVKFNDNKMIIPWQFLSKGETDSLEFTSRYGNKKYKLVNYPWNPDQDNQLRML